MKICPLTGKPCYHDKLFQITDLKNGKVTKNQKVCHECLGECLKDKEENTFILEVKPNELVKLDDEDDLGEVDLETIGQIESEEIDLELELELEEIDHELELELEEIELQLEIDLERHEEEESEEESATQILKNIVEFIDYITDPDEKSNESELPGKKKQQPAACPQCKCTLEEIGKSGRIGCAMCYTFFDKEINNVIKHSQKAIKHTGKRPKIYDPAEIKKLTQKAIEQAKKNTEEAMKLLPLDIRIKKLKAEMQRFVKSEEYEKAAEVRDKINGLQYRFKQIKKLKSQMKRAVKNEQYERADGLKKEIEKLEEKNNE
ncbi:MAG: UvrB/UvrC motif-containing protein [Candidatus Thorarchaeota archaeon]|jgi:protein-arginine kinase activator protein McsA